MPLFADRFVPGDGQSGLDLATGDRVVLVVSSAGGVSDQRRWVMRCDALQKSQSAALARLVDYGMVGESQRFEAWDREPGNVADEIEPVALTRPAWATIAELFEQAGGVRPRVSAVWAPDEADTRGAVLDLARAARLHGFVPIAARLAPAYGEWLRGRSLFIIDDSGRSGWHVLLEAALTAPRPHVLLFVAREEMAGVDAVCVRSSDRKRPAGMVIRRQRGVRAAEQPAVYGAPDVQEALDPCPTPFSSPGRERAWPVPAELVELRRRLDSGIRLVQRGRHAPGERLLRQAVHGLARRQDSINAAEGAMALAFMLLDRGRPRDAQTALESAAGWWRHAGNEARLIDVAVLGGRAWTDLTRLDEAEGVLSAALTASRVLGDAARQAAASVGLAQVMFWRGQYAEADRLLAAIDPGSADEALVVRIRYVSSTVAVGLRQLDRAVSQALSALADAERAGQAGLVAEAAAVAAFAHQAVGDVSAVERDVAMATTAARAAHRPIAATCSRLILVEAHRRSGRRPAALRLLARLRGACASRLPPLVSARVNLLSDVLAHGATDDIVRRHVASTGLHALALQVPTIQPAAGPFAPMVDDIVHLLDLCQTSDDERTVLAEVCRQVRTRVSAVAVGFAVAEGSASRAFVWEGKRVELPIANRAMAAKTTIAPHRCDDRVEAAAPVRYGGDVIGALVARWTIGTPHDLSHAGPLLTATAAVVAPVLSGAIARQRRCSSSETRTMLLGVSEAMAAVRDGIERAAAAPFAALVEGESGSGKELVARALHRAGPRRDRPYCTLNCAALPDDLVEAELFGHARGAFTGAVAERPGVFEEANGGTLLLDEIGELSLRAQAKVLRVIQEGELRRIGENVSRRVDVRIVSATNRDLRQEVSAGRFRLDLLYRLDVLRITVPPLRERREDIAVMAEHFWREAASRVNSRATLSNAAIASLVRYDWPGNARELQNVMASLAVRSPRRGIVPPTALGPQFSARRFAEAARLAEARRAFEERFVRAALVRTGGHRGRAAEELGVSRQGLTKLMARLGLLQ